MTERELTQTNEPEEQSLADLFSGISLSANENIAVQALDTYDLTLEQKRETFKLFVWHETGSLAPLKRFGDIREDEGSRIRRILEDDDFVDFYDEFYDEYLSRQPDRKKQVLKTARQSETIEDVAKEVEIDIFDAKKIIVEKERERNKKEAKRKMLKRKNWARIKDMREQGLSRSQISEQTEESIEKIRKITTALIFMDIIKAYPRGKARSEALKKLASNISDLIDSGIWDFFELADQLGVSTKKIRTAVLLMIDGGRKDLIQIYDDNDRYTRKYRDKLRLIEDLWNNQKKSSLEIADEIEMPIEWVRNRLRYLREKKRIEKRYKFVDRKKLKKDMLIFLQNYDSEKQGKSVSAKIIIAGVGGGDDQVREIHAELAQIYDIPQLTKRPGKYDRERLEEMILSAVQGFDNNTPVNVAQMYRDLNPECGKITFYNVYRELARRIQLPPLKHGGRVSK